MSEPPIADHSSGPTPFPPIDSPEWPGRGVIWLFPFMVDNRNVFWAHRSEARGAIVFIGDSLVGGWQDMAQQFSHRHVANRGIGGDVSRGALFRFREDVLDLHPKAIVILVGSNDLGAGESPDATLSNIREMLGMAAQAEPGAPVILCTVPPRDSKKDPVPLSQLRELNDGIIQLGRESPNVCLLDLFPLFARVDGSPDPQYFAPDLLHLGPAGFARWHEALEPLFARLNL